MQQFVYPVLLIWDSQIFRTDIHVKKILKKSVDPFHTVHTHTPTRDMIKDENSQMMNYNIDDNRPVISFNKDISN